jgi:DNA-binding transcriptional ArsR family regulator
MPGRHTTRGQRATARDPAAEPSAARAHTDILARYFRALGDPTRLSILELLAAEERSVTDIVTPLGLSQPNVSNHLGCLRRCGLVSTRRAQRKVIYRIADTRLVPMIALARELIRDHDTQIATCQTAAATRR